MREGEEITITYTGKVDFSKDTDGDGKITADQTKNTVSVEPKEGDPHTSDYSREIRFKYTVKKDGTVSSTTTTGDKIIDWEIDYNQLALAKAGGDTITDRISSDSTSYMKYYGSGITVVVKDHLGNIVRTDTIPYANLTAHSDSSWTYTIPDSDTKPYSYHITYQTIVDMEKVNGGGANVVLNNTANDDGGSVSVTPENKITVDKQVESFTTEEITWNTTLSIPENGLTRAVVTDTLPHIWLDDGNHYDVFKDYSLVISGLLDGEVYKVSYLEGQVVITFYKSYQDESNNEPGLKPSTGGRTINVRLTTMVDQEWLEKGYESGGWYQNHTNTIDFNSVIDTATVIFGKPGITKTADTTDEKSFKYTLTIAGLEDEPFSITDTFDTSLLEVDTSKNGTWNHMYIWGGNQYSQDSGHIPVSYTDTEDGIVITANTVPKDDNGKYYSYYKIIYYLKLKDGVDLEQLAIANGGEYDIDNTAIWGEHETTYTYKKKYDFLDKELLNEGEIGGTNRTALYKITFNSAKATLNKGEPMEMTDVLSDNLSLDYGSVTITTDPPGAEVPYSVSGGKDDQGNPDGTTVATYTIPDSTKVEITYSAQVRGNGSQKIVNKVSVNGEDDTEEHTENYGAADEGEGAIASFKIVKVDGYNANKKLSGVKFKIFAEKPSLDFGDGKKELILETDENGEITLDGEKYKFFFNEIYHVQEIEAPEDYGQISFDYLVTLTNDMARVDYGHYIYYYSDSMQIKNWPLEGLIVEKQVDSDEAADKDRYYTFRVSILDDEGKVDETYNEKNGDDQFENGVVEFQLKDREQKMFWGFKKGTKYKVEEIDADGFATSITYSIFDEEGNIIDTITAPGTSHSGELTQEDEVIVFKNSKHNEVGSLKIKKTVTENGQAPSDAAKAILAGTYTFTLYTDEACKTPYTVDGQPKTVTLTIPDTGAAVTSEEVTDLPPGDYWIKETSPTNGSSPVTNPVKVKVEAGKTGEEAVIAQFTNNLTGIGEIKVKKELNGRDWTNKDEFTFTLSAADGTPMPGETQIKIKNDDGDQTKSFGKIKFTEAGTYTYTVKETKGTLGGVIYDETDHTVIIKVVDDGNGNLIAENGDSLIKVVMITNTYKARGVADVKVAKHLVGKTLEEGTFTFTISAVGNAPMNKANGTAIPATDLTVTNGADAEAVKFPTFYYTLEDAKKVYIYKIVEDDFNIPGVSRDTETGPEEIYAKANEIIRKYRA